MARDADLADPVGSSHAVPSVHEPAPPVPEETPSVRRSPVNTMATFGFSRLVYSFGASCGVSGRVDASRREKTSDVSDSSSLGS